MVRQRPAWQFLIAPAAASAIALQASLPAQNQPSDPATLIRLDSVVATVNDAVILESEVTTLTIGVIRTREAELHRRLTPDERVRIFRQRLGEKIDQHALAQAAKTLGVIPPDRVEAILQEQLREDEREQIRELGSMQKLTEERRRQNQNSTWQAVEREQRIAKSADLTRQMAVSVRLQNQRNLFITPRMMRDFYRRHLDQFVHGASADLGTIAFQGPGAAATAAEAAATWRKEDLQPEELAERFAARGAFLPEALHLDDSSRKVRRVDQVDFALAGPKGRVADPIDLGGTFRLWKILAHYPSRNEPFDSPEVQRVIRDFMERDVVDQLLQQTIERSRQRTEVWLVPDLLR